jgi:hypothetical protein
MPAGNTGFYKKDDGEKAVECGIIGRRMKFFYYIRRFWEIPKLERRLLLASIYWYFYFSVIIRLAPLKFYLPYLRFISNKEVLIEENIAFHITRKTANRISCLFPFEYNCLAKSLVYKYLLLTFNINTEIILEAYKGSENDLKLHAYVKYQGKPVYLFNDRNYNSAIVPF